jgi:hypothetical protein
MDLALLPHKVLKARYLPDLSVESHYHRPSTAFTGD